MEMCLILSLSLVVQSILYSQIKGFLVMTFLSLHFSCPLHLYLIFSVDMGQYSRPLHMHTHVPSHTCTVALPPELSGCLWMHRGGRERETHKPKERPLGHANANMFPHWCPMSALITSSSRPPGPIRVRGCTPKSYGIGPSSVTPSLLLTLWRKDKGDWWEVSSEQECFN